MTAPSITGDLATVAGLVARGRLRPAIGAVVDCQRGRRRELSRRAHFEFTAEAMDSGAASDLYLRRREQPDQKGTPHNADYEWNND